MDLISSSLHCSKKLEDVVKEQALASTSVLSTTFLTVCSKFLFYIVNQPWRALDIQFKYMIKKQISDTSQN